jgi:signal peptidase I
MRSTKIIRKEMVATMEKETTKQDIREKQMVVFRFLIKLAEVLLVIWAIFTFVFGIHQVHGETMYPMIRDGDLLLYFRLEHDYQNDDAVVYERNGTRCVARIVARGGDVVELNTDGMLVVNGNVQEEEVFYPTKPEPMGTEYPYTVPEESYFVLCDFRTNSDDSRYYGAVSEKDLDGKIITILRRRGI